MFHEYFMGRPYPQDTCEINSLAWLFNFQHVLLTCLFHKNPYSRASCELVAKLHWFFISCSILYQLNTKPNTIKSHKIQGTKKMQLQHFLSWNKANIKHSCKSQLYKMNDKKSWFLDLEIWLHVGKVLGTLQHLSWDTPLFW